jgi:DHA2 family multidrug resistance protein
MRNVGSSVGISIVAAELARNAVINRVELIGNLTPFDPDLDAAASALSGSREALLTVLDNEVTRQALMIGYVDDFKLMMLVTLAVIPLLLFLRKPGRTAAGGSMPAMAAAD